MCITFEWNVVEGQFWCLLQYVAYKYARHSGGVKKHFRRCTVTEIQSRPTVTQIMGMYIPFDRSGAFFIFFCLGVWRQSSQPQFLISTINNLVEK